MARLGIQMTGKRARLIFSVPMSVDPMSHPRLPGGDVSPSWRGMGPLDQASELCGHTLPEMGQRRILSFAHPLSPANPMGQAGLPGLRPCAVSFKPSETRIPAQWPISSSRAALERLALTLKKATVWLTISHTRPARRAESTRFRPRG